MSGYTIVARDDAPDFMAQYPGYGEMRFFTEPLDDRAGRLHLALDAVRAPAARAPTATATATQEEIYFVVSGNARCSSSATTSSRSGPHTAVRVAPETFRSVHNDGPEEAELVICSVKTDDPRREIETTPDFWPDG